jgi:hypothetical protein
LDEDNRVPLKLVHLSTIIIIINKETALFESIIFLRRFYKIASGFHVFGFRSNIFYFTEQGRQPYVQALVLISRRNRVAQSYPQALGSLFVASCDPQGYGGGIFIIKYCVM